MSGMFASAKSFARSAAKTAEEAAVLAKQKADAAMAKAKVRVRGTLTLTLTLALTLTLTVTLTLTLTRSGRTTWAPRRR